MKKTITKPERLEAVVTPPGDKSISHRAALLNGISKGRARLSNFCVGDDRISMIGCLRDLGVDISPVPEKPNDFEIYGVESLSNATKNDMTFLNSSKYKNLSLKTKAAA